MSANATSELDGRDPRPVIHLSGLVGSPVTARDGERVGKVEDAVVRLVGGRTHPPVTGLVVGVGDRGVFIAAEQIETLAQDGVALARDRVDLRRFERRDGEVLLRADLLGHRLIDVPAAELVHAYDIELDDTGAGWVLSRLDTRRPARFFGLVPRGGGHASRDWSSFEPLIGHDASRSSRRVGGRVSTLKAAQIADLLEDASDREGGEILDRLHTDPELEADVFEELNPDKATRLLGDMTDADVAAVLGRMRADDAADAVADLRQSRRRRVLDLMPAGQRTKVITLMGYNPASAGGLMSVDVATCPVTATAGQALAVVAAATTMQPEALIKVHVLDAAGSLRGVVSLVRLVQADPGTAVTELMDTDPVRVTPTADVPDVALLMADYNLTTIPVVDPDDRVVGVVTVDDVLEDTIPEDWRRREPTPRPAHEDVVTTLPAGRAPDSGDRRG